MTLTNCTVAGNTGQFGEGGVLNTSGTMNVVNTTISGNSAPSGPAGGIGNSATLNRKNTILANNTAVFDPNCLLNGGTATSYGHSPTTLAAPDSLSRPVT